MAGQNSRRRGSPLLRWLRFCGVVLAAAILARTSFSQRETTGHWEILSASAAWAEPQGAVPLGQFLTVAGPVDDVVYARINRAALDLQLRARQAGRPAVLVLEILPGSSQFHHVQGLARFLAEDLTGVRTVAWVPGSLNGNQVVLALACQEIVLHPDAELGDIGLGQQWDPIERQFVLNLAGRRHNSLLSESLVRGMLDRQQELIWTQIQTGQPPQVTTESKVVLPEEFERLLAAKAILPRHEILKPAGAPGVFTGRKARSFNILAKHAVESREALAKLYQLTPADLREELPMAVAAQTVLIHINDFLDPVVEQFVLRQMDRAVNQGATTLVFEINTPGGRLEHSANLALEITHVAERKVRTIAYVPRDALHGGALLALACDQIFLHPQARLGEAGILEDQPGPQPKPGRGRRKPAPRPEELQEVEEYLTALAERKGRPAGILRAMGNRNLPIFEARNNETGELAFKSLEEFQAAPALWTKGPKIPESRAAEYLVLTASRAHELRLTERPVESFEDFRLRIGIPPGIAIPASAPTWVDRLIFVLNQPWMTALLFMLGMFCAYLEMHFPSGFFGICSTVAFGIFFWSRWQATAGWLEVVLFAIGAGCLALEVFVLPGFGVFGVSGAILVLLSLVLAVQTFVIPQSIADMEQMVESITTVGGAILGMGIIGALTAKFLPRMRMFDALVLLPPSPGATPRLSPALQAAVTAGTLLERSPSLIGRRGVAQTLLRPAGKVAFGEELVDVVSDGEFIRAGTPVEVVAVTGMRVVVRQCAN